MKNRILGGGGSWKNQYRGGGLPKKVGLGHFADLRGAWQERGSDVFKGGGGRCPQCTLWFFTLVCSIPV